MQQTISPKPFTALALGSQVVVQAEAAQEKSRGGIVIPKAAQEKSQRGTVVAVGPGHLLRDGNRSPLLVSVGDSVVFKRYAGTEVEIDDEAFTVLDESDLLLVLQND